MSSGSITISYTTLAEIAVAAAVIGGVAFIGSKQVASSPIKAAGPPSSASSSSSSSSKSKKKKQQQSSVVAPVVDAVQLAAERVQPAVVEVKDKVVQLATDASASSTTTKPPTNNKKKNKKGGNKTPPAAAAAAAAAPEKPNDKKKDDMRDYELEPQPTPARVLKIVGGEIGADPAAAKSARGEDGWEKPDAFQDDDDEGGWESVVSKKPSRPSTPSLSLNSTTTSAARTVPGLAQPQTKKQRENAARKAKEDALKRERDDEQERRLKAHRDALNRARQHEAALANRPKPSTQNFFGSEPVPATTTKPAVSGHLHAGLDPTNDGSLVWD
ncbi:hypothetical protein JCM11491_001112 [Sporobolomyces phaffii]